MLGLDVNASAGTYRVERVDAVGRAAAGGPGRGRRAGRHRPEWMPAADARRRRDYGIRLSLADVKGITDAEVARIVAGQPYASLADFWHRAPVSRPVVERLVLAGGFDSLYGFGGARAASRRDRPRPPRAGDPARPAAAGRRARPVVAVGHPLGRRLAPRTSRAATASAARASSLSRSAGTGHQDVRALAAASVPGRRPVVPAPEQPTQLTLDLGDTPELTAATGLPEMTGAERVRAELEVLGLDASRHVVDFYAPLLDALGVTRRRDLLGQRSGAEVLVAGVKVATQTPPIRSGRRVVFLTLDDATGPVDATFFEDVQGPYAATVFHSWLLVVRGVLRRTGPRGVSLRATGAWELSALWDAWTRGGIDAVHAALAAADERAHVLAAAGAAYAEDAGAGAAQSRSSRPVMAPAAAMGLPGGLRAAGDPGRGRRSAGRRHGWRPAPGAGPRHRVQAVALRRHQAGGRRRQGLAQAARRGPRRARSRPARAASGHRAAQAVARQPGQLGALG